MIKAGRATILLAIVALSTIGYSAYSLWLYFEYERYDLHVPAQKMQWSVVSNDEENNHLEASYTYLVNNFQYEGNYLFKKPVFINKLGAEHAVADFSKDYTHVWVASKQPKNSTLQHRFPLKELISAAILWGLCIYFISLVAYYRQFDQH